MLLQIKETEDLEAPPRNKIKYGGYLMFIKKPENNFKKSNLYILLSLLFIIPIIICGCSSSPDRADEIFEQFTDYFDSSIKNKPESTRNEEAFFEKSDVSYYLYNTLDDSEKKIYSEIYDAMNHYDSYALLSCDDVEVAKKLYSYVLFDHPEIFWVDAISFEEIVNKNNYEMYFKPNFIFSSDEIKEYIKTIDEYFFECMAGCASDDEYYLSKYFYEYIIENTAYNENSEYDQTIIGAISSKESVCAGYAKLYQFLLQRNGIECTIVTGIANNTNHAWNLTNVNGEYYYTDTTWGDMDYTGENTLNNVINYSFLNVTTEEITKTHSFDDNISFPVYSAINDNYYVKEGYFITEYNKNFIRNVISNQKEQGYATIKCENQNIYDAVYDYLINNFHIMDFTSDKDSIEYLKDDNLFILTFGL